MIRKHLAGILLLGTAVLLSGCTTKYEENDIQSYIKEELGLDQYTVSADCEEQEGEDGYTDKIWTVTDEKNAVTFHVIDDYHWGAETLVNSLNNDYEASVFLKYQDQLPESDLVKNGRVTITAGTDTEGIAEASMEAMYQDRAELQSILDLLKEYNSFFKSLGFEEINVSAEILYEGPDSYPCKGNMVGGDGYSHLKSDQQYVFEEILNKYILTGLDYRLEEVFADTTEEERQAVILADQTDRVGIVRENGETEYYEDLVGSSYSYGLSFSTLYQVLEREGLAPEGDERHFTCTGADGRNYEFSCDFVSWDFDGEEMSYYLADGEPVKLWRPYNIHIRAKEASDLFGIRIVTDWNKTIAENESK